jgi:hypothetical protein
MAINVLTLMKGTNLHIQEAQQIIRRINSDSFELKQIIMKYLKVKDKEKILGAARR